MENLHTGNLIRFKNLNNFETITEPIVAEFLFIFPKDVYFTKPTSKKDKPRVSKNLGDLSNLIQLPEDCLQKAKIIANDNLIRAYGNSGLRYWNDPDHRLIINIFTFDSDSEYHEGR